MHDDGTINMMTPLETGLRAQEIGAGLTGFERIALGVALLQGVDAPAQHAEVQRAALIVFQHAERLEAERLAQIFGGPTTHNNSLPNRGACGPHGLRMSACAPPSQRNAGIRGALFSQNGGAQ